MFLTAPGEVKLTRKGEEVVAETLQMRKRIKYFTLRHEIPEGKRQEVLRVCPHCTARVYLEGRATLDNRQETLLASPCTPPSQPSFLANGPDAKRARTATQCVQELKDLKLLLDSGVLTAEEFSNLKGRLLRGE